MRSGTLPDVGRALRDAAPAPHWLDRPERPAPAAPLAGPDSADLAVVGGGYSGLRAALLARQADPGRDVVLLEAGTCGWAASGRNGGFCAASLTHGLAKGIDRFPDEIGELERLGAENLDAIEAAVGALGIDCDFERTGELVVAVEPYRVAVEPYRVAALAEAATPASAYGHDVTILDRDGVQAEVHSHPRRCRSRPSRPTGSAST